MDKDVLGCLPKVIVPVVLLFFGVALWVCHEGDVVLDGSYRPEIRYERSMGFPDDHRAIFGDGRFALRYGSRKSRGYHLDDQETNSVILWNVIKARQKKNIVVLTCQSGSMYTLDLQTGILERQGDCATSVEMVSPLTLRPQEWSFK